jgi:competence protein ComEA
MDVQELISKYSPFIRKNWLPLILGILGMIFFTYGLIGLLGTGKSASNEVVFESNSSVAANQTPSGTKTILVDVEGAVVRPGVYKIPLESRIRDGLIVAGGLSAQADREYIAKNLNLATKLSDGAKVYFPVIGEAAGGAALPNSSSTVASDALISVNTASVSDLDSLPGIGPVTAQKIIAGRPYGVVSELVDRKIVGAKVFDQIKDKISIY